ncbi:MAG: hypothetical protein KF729_15385 [Sandaracinaceae bacterium]|nr:hypothetical protein [Sandaracinaceae bacterium]
MGWLTVEASPQLRDRHRVPPHVEPRARPDPRSQPRVEDERQQRIVLVRDPAESAVQRTRAGDVGHAQLEQRQEMDVGALGSRIADPIPDVVGDGGALFRAQRFEADREAIDVLREVDRDLAGLESPKRGA